MNKIKRLSNLETEEKIIEDKLINDVERNPKRYIEIYKSFDSSMNGNYICADLFKKTFTIYQIYEIYQILISYFKQNKINYEDKSLIEEAQKILFRLSPSLLEQDLNYYRVEECLKKDTDIVAISHNSSAVLSNELFMEKAEDKSIKNCVFLSGVPGGGKSFFIQSLNYSGDILDDTMIFEGDISSPSIYEKFDKVIENGKNVEIIIINPTLELAMQNVINRSFEIGRGASPETMARIISKIPESIRNLLKVYQENININIYNKISNYDITLHDEKDLFLLEHGDYTSVLNNLKELREKILSNYCFNNRNIDLSEAVSKFFLEVNSKNKRDLCTIDLQVKGDGIYEKGKKKYREINDGKR